MEFLALAGALSPLVALIARYVVYNIVYKSIDYSEHSTEGTDVWRWRKPDQDLGILIEESDLYESAHTLTLKDGNTVSSLIPRSRLALGEPAAHLMGFGFLGMAIFGILGVLIHRPENMAWVLGPCFFCLGVSWFLINVGNQARRIDLYADRLEIVTKYAFFCDRRRCYRPHPKLRFQGKYQSLLSMEKRQFEPDYKLMVTKPFLGLFSFQHQFLIACDKTQGSWIVGGLEAWNRVANANDQTSG